MCSRPRGRPAGARPRCGHRALNARPRSYGLLARDGAGQVTLGGRRVSVKRVRVRAADDNGEVAYEHFADRDPLTKVVLEQMLAGVSRRRFSPRRGFRPQVCGINGSR